MAILKFFIETIADILHIVLTAYMWIIIIQSLLTWVRPDPHNAFVRMLDNLTAPAYNFIRRRVRTVFQNVDLAPLLIVLCVLFLDIFLSKVLNYVSVSL